MLLFNFIVFFCVLHVVNRKTKSCNVSKKALRID